MAAQPDITGFTFKDIYTDMERDDVLTGDRPKRPLRMSRRPDIRQPTGIMSVVRKREMRHDKRV